MKYLKYIAVILLLILASCKEPSGKKGMNQQNKKQEVVPVIAKEIVPTDLNEYITITGKLEGIVDITLTSEISGKIIELNKELGDWVNKGEEIGKIDNTDYQLRVTQAEAALTAAQTNLKSARLQYQNSSELYEKQQVSEIEFNQAENSFENAKSAVQNGKVGLQQAQRNLENSKFTAPVAGSITQLNIEVGEYIGMGAPVANIVNAREMIINTGVGVNEIGAIKRGNTVEVFCQNEMVKTTGEIIGKGIKQMTNSSNYPIKVKLANPDKKLYPGMVVNIKIIVNTFENAIFLPFNSLIQQYDKNYVYVVKGDKAEKVELTFAKEVNGNVLISAGLNQGDKIVVDGYEILTANSILDVKKLIK